MRVWVGEGDGEGDGEARVRGMVRGMVVGIALQCCVVVQIAMKTALDLVTKPTPVFADVV